MPSGLGQSYPLGADKDAAAIPLPKSASVVDSSGSTTPDRETLTPSLDDACTVESTAVVAAFLADTRLCIAVVAVGE